MPDDGYEVKLSDSEMGELIRHRRDRDILLRASPRRPAAGRSQPAEKRAGQDKPRPTMPAEPQAEKPAGRVRSRPRTGPRRRLSIANCRRRVDYLTQELARAQ